MSVTALINQHGQSIQVARPTTTVDTSGAMSRSYALAATLDGWLQPRSATDSNFSGRADMQTSGTAYFPGVPDIRTDDVLILSGTDYWHVTGVRTPILRPATGPNSHTVVDCVQREGESIVLPS